MLLRESLERAVKLLDPEGTDPGLRRMVVIGHSQGGLLAKMTAIDSGSKFWDLAFKRVVFLATPHRGSSLTVGRFAEWVADRIEASSRRPSPSPAH